MKHSAVKLSDLVTVDEHYDAISEIERDYQNIQGGFHAWNSGYETHLTAVAQKKIDAIEKRIDRLFPCDDGQ